MPNALEDLEFWLQHDSKKIKKIFDLFIDICHHPETGLGKPEPLKHDLAGFWSRRLDQTNRILYDFDKDAVYIYQARFHYD